jgi:hypothetical protein
MKINLKSEKIYESVAERDVPRKLSDEKLEKLKDLDKKKQTK